MRQVGSGSTVAAAAARAGMSEKTARKYRKLGRSPSDCRPERTWRTREDPFCAVWPEVQELLGNGPGLQAITLLEELQRRYPGQFQDGQLRTLQRKVKLWRATEGPAKEVFFPQQHHPGVLCQSDFCHLSCLGVIINGARFEHLLYHFVLTYSNWESATICLSESAESLREGLQNALWELGGVPQRHRSDSLSAAVKRPGQDEPFTQSYQALMNHYGLAPEHTQPGRPNENGDVEQRHHRLRERLDQALLLRGSREFESRTEYEQFLKEQLTRANQGRKGRLEEERAHLRPLPLRRLEAYQRYPVRVGKSSTIRVKHGVYTVPSRLIGEEVEARLYAERLEVWYGQRKVEECERIVRPGSTGYRINYRHIIDWLVRKPGAFAQYRYREALFPSSTFRMAYDLLCHQRSQREADKEYLKILEMAAKQSEQQVEDALRYLLEEGATVLDTTGAGEALCARGVEEILGQGVAIPAPTEVVVEPVNLASYDVLLAICDTGVSDALRLEGSHV